MKGQTGRRAMVAAGVLFLAAATGLVVRGQEAAGKDRPVPPVKTIPGVEVPQQGLLGVAGPFAHKNLTVFYLYEQKHKPDVEYITLEEGVKAGLVKVSESPEVRVEQLVITNDSERPLFLVSGDLVRGGKQDRTIRMSMVIPPKTTGALLPALCVERSRWAGEAGFAAQGDVVGSLGQSAMNRPADESRGSQEGVWESVSSYKGSLRRNAAKAAGRPVGASKTSSMTEELNDKDIQDLINGYVRAVGEKYLPLPRPLGLAYAVDGKLTGLHVFHSSSLFRQLALKLLRAAATDAAAAAFDKAPPAVTVKDLANFIAAAWDGKKSTETPGLGNEIIRYVAAETFTTQLYFKKVLVHSQVGRREAPPPAPKPEPRPAELDRQDNAPDPASVRPSNRRSSGR